MRYQTRYVHKISPQDTDVGPSIEVAPTDLMDRRALGAALRRAKILTSGDKIRDFRVENDRVVVFPQASIWHSIILHLPGTAALPPKKTGPETYQKFTYKPYGPGQKMRCFYASSPVTWAEARDRLIAAGVMDPGGAGRSGGWMLSVDPRDYVDRLAEALP